MDFKLPDDLSFVIERENGDAEILHTILIKFNDGEYRVTPSREGGLDINSRWPVKVMPFAANRIVINAEEP